MEPTRELRSIACAGCNICLAISDETLRRKCAACGHDNTVSAELIEDSDFLRRLGFDANDEAKMALARSVDGRYKQPEFPRWVPILAALIGAGIGGYSALSDGWISVLAWTLGGAFVTILIVGWTIQWVQSTTAAGVLRSVQKHVQENVPRKCPSCDTDVDAATPGTFPCSSCQSTLVSSNTLIGMSGMSRQEAWDSQAKLAIKDIESLDDTRLGVGEVAWVVLTILVVLAILAWVRLDIESMILPRRY